MRLQPVGVNWSAVEALDYFGAKKRKLENSFPPKEANLKYNNYVLFEKKPEHKSRHFHIHMWKLISCVFRVF